MSSRHNGREEKGALELLEEAIHLVRTSPPRALAYYYTGAVPFLIGLLYFWTDMRRSPYAEAHLAEATLGMAGLFLWMKFFQALFARELRLQLIGEDPGRLGWRGAIRVFVGQAAWQPTGLFVLPLAAIVFLPLAWPIAFYQSLSASGSDQETARGGLGRSAWRQARLWPIQNHVILILLGAFSLAVLLNWVIVGFALPSLLKSLFGLETVFTRGASGLLNSTFFAATFCLTYLCVDPIAKAVYVERCFYSDSVESGEDLRVELARVGQAGRQAALAVLVLGLGCCACFGSGAASDGAVSNASAAPASARAAGPELSAPELDRQIQEVIRQSKYTWRAPRERVLRETKSESGILGRFLERVGRLIKNALKGVFDILEKVFEWLARVFEKIFGRLFRLPKPTTPGYGWVMGLNLLLYLLIAAVVLALGYLAYRIWLHWHPREKPVASEPLQPVPDVADENVSADQLPEDGWLKLARELLARGELRLGLRALYLASLAHLAGQNLIAVAKFKSNRDYERELQRRAHCFPEVLALFSDNSAVFDRTWYGLHELDPPTVAAFAANVDRIRGPAAPKPA